MTDDGNATPDNPDQADQYDPGQYTVDQVNTYLADADADEQARVLAMEADGRNRSGIVHGPYSDDSEDAPDQADTDQADTSPEDAAPDTQDGAFQAAQESQDTGVVGDTAGPDDDGAVKPVTDSAPDDADGEPYQQGYVGELPTDQDGNRPDLTVQGVLKDQGA